MIEDAASDKLLNASAVIEIAPVMIPAKNFVANRKILQQIPTIPAGYHLWKIDDKIPEGGKANVTIVPGEERTIPVIFIEQERAAVLATVTDADEPVHNATVRVRGEHDGVPVEVMGTTDVNGMVYLVPEEPTTFLPDTPYTLTVSADGYDEEEEQDITISALHEVSVTLEKS